MGKFVDGVKSLFTGADTSAQDAAIAKQREEQELALAKQREIAQNEEADADVAGGAVRRLPRGRRLLLAATSNDKLGG